MFNSTLLTRRDFLVTAGTVVIAPAVIYLTRRHSAPSAARGTPGNVTIVEFTDAGVRAPGKQAPGPATRRRTNLSRGL
jgi:hypothetical protein